MTCPAHNWRWTDDPLPYDNGNGVGYVKCQACGALQLAKPRRVSRSDLPRVAHEIICAKLRELLRQRGVVMDVLPYSLALVGELGGASVAPPRLCSVMPSAGAHSRIKRTSVFEADWPRWLFTFDRWVGRLDGDGDTNLLLISGTKRVVPIDWELAFPWAVAEPRVIIRRVEDLSVPTHPCVVTAADTAALVALKRVNDEAIWTAVHDCMTPELLHPAVATAYWSGLCLRRDLLIKEAGL